MTSCGTPVIALAGRWCHLRERAWNHQSAARDELDEAFIATGVEGLEDRRGKVGLAVSLPIVPSRRQLRSVIDNAGINGHRFLDLNRCCATHVGHVHRRRQ
jgi:hypothetical protein